MKKYIYRLGLAGAAAAFVLVSSPIVFALPVQATNHAQTAATAADSVDPASDTTTDKPSSDKGALKRAEASKRVCEKRQKAVTNIMTRISDRGQKQLTLFDTIATRVEMFYTDKGRTVSNYDTLVADVNAKKAAAQEAVDTVSSESATFSCDSSEPKAAVTTFKDSLKLEISALKDYRTAVKNLIVGVKSAQGTAASAGSTSDGGNQ